MRAEREAVHLGAGDAPAVGDHLGADPLRDEVVALEELGREGAAPLLLRALVDGEADVAHVLDAAADDHVVDAGGDPQRREVDRLLPGAAAARRPSSRPRSTGRPFASHAVGVMPLDCSANWLRAAGDHVLDLGRVDPGALEHGDEAAAEQVGGVDVA